MSDAAAQENGAQSGQPAGGPLRYRDVQVGDALPPFTKWITAKSAVKFGATYKDVFSGHINPKVSVGQFGVNSMPVQGAVLEAGASSLMVNWLRSVKPWLYGGRQESKFIKIVVPGDTLRYGGTVTRKEEVDGRGLVHVDIFAENQRGEKVMVGSARVTLPLE